MIYYRIISLIFCLFAAAPVTAGILLLEDSHQTVDAEPYLEIYYDLDGEIDSETATTKQFAENFDSNLKNYPHMGFKEIAYWFKFTIRSESQKSWYLLIDFPIIREVKAYTKPADSPGTAIKNDKILLPQKYRSPLYRLDLPPGEAFDIYLHVEKNLGQVHIPIRLMRADPLLKRSQQHYIFFATIFAGITVLAIYNLILLFHLKNLGYLSLVIFIVSIQLLLYRENGIFPDINFINDPGSYFHTTPALLTLASGLFFWGYINDLTPSWSGRLFTYWIPLACLAVVPFSGLIPDVHQQLSTLSIILSPFIVYQSLRNIIRLETFNKSSFAILLFTISIQPYLFNHSNIYLTDFPTSIYLAHTGILLALILLSFMQADYTRKLCEESERNQAINAPKDEFLTTMSHELRTPMNAIKGCNELLQMTQPTAKQQNYLEKQQTAANHMMKLVNQVLDLSSLEKQAIKIEAQPFDLQLLFDELHKIFADEAHSKGIALHLDNLVYPEVLLVGDKTRLLQTLINLIGNSLKFTQKGFVKLTAIKKNQHANSIVIEFMVRDTGPGIPKQARDKLFKPFTTLDNSPSRKQRGTGLGLAISHKLVKLMGGELHLENTSTVGSCFRFTLQLETRPWVAATNPSGQQYLPQ